MNILITGTSSGLGNALAIQFLENGASVFGISRRINEALLDYSQYHHLSHDLSILDEIPLKLNYFLSGIKTLDLVILNAGTTPKADHLGRIPVKEVTNLMQVNVWANKIIIDSIIKMMPVIYQVVAITSGQVINKIRDLHTFSLSKSILMKWIQLYSHKVPSVHFSALSPGIINSGLMEYVSSLPNEKNCPYINELKSIRESGQMPAAQLVANYLVEVMGSVLQNDSGTYYDIEKTLLAVPASTETSKRRMSYSDN